MSSKEVRRPVEKKVGMVCWRIKMARPVRSSHSASEMGVGGGEGGDGGGGDVESGGRVERRPRDAEE